MKILTEVSRFVARLREENAALTMINSALKRDLLDYVIRVKDLEAVIQEKNTMIRKLIQGIDVLNKQEAGNQCENT